MRGMVKKCTPVEVQTTTKVKKKYKKNYKNLQKRVSKSLEIINVERFRKVNKGRKRNTKFRDNRKRGDDVANKRTNIASQ
jgi:hypothetical protein